MDKMCSAPVAGKYRPLLFSMEVMFDTAAKFGSMADCFDALEREDRAGTEAICWMMTRLVNEGEAYRRDAGFDPDKLFAQGEITINTPAWYRIYKQAVLKAIELGYTREVEDPDEEVDLVLQEIKAKKAEAGD